MLTTLCQCESGLSGVLQPSCFVVHNGAAEARASGRRIEEHHNGSNHFASGNKKVKVKRLRLRLCHIRPPRTLNINTQQKKATKPPSFQFPRGSGLSTYRSAIRHLTESRCINHGRSIYCCSCSQTKVIPSKFIFALLSLVSRCVVLRVLRLL